MRKIDQRKEKQIKNEVFAKKYEEAAKRARTARKRSVKFGACGIRHHEPKCMCIYEPWYSMESTQAVSSRR